LSDVSIENVIYIFYQRKKLIG